MSPTANTGAKLSPGPFLLGLFLVTGSALALEVLDTRMLSVLTWYSLAFLVIAMGLFGFTAGALHVYFHPERYDPEHLARSLAAESLKLALAIPVSYGLLLVIPLRTDPVATTVFLFLAFAAAIALPFYPAGIIVAAAVTRSPFPVGRVYAVDLLGAALGAPLVPLLLGVLDGGSAILALSVVATLAAAAFAWSGGDRRYVTRSALTGITLLGLMAANASTSKGLVPLWVKGVPEHRELIEQELWNSHSRVAVLKEGRVPASFWGKGTKCQPPLITQRALIIDGHAMTPLYHVSSLEQLRFLDCDVTNVVHQLRPKGSIAIIGVGGSRDLQAALLAGHQPVVGIELNQRLLDILDGPLGKPTLIPDHPHVELVHDDGRSYLARSERHFDVIQASLIDTWAATGAGAHALGENGLYTQEAWSLFLSKLKPGGMLTVSRWSTVETARLIALAVGALLDQGKQDPQAHIALVGAGIVTTLLVSRDPLTAQDVQKLDAAANKYGFFVQAAPGRLPGAERLRKVLTAKSAQELEQVTLLPHLDFRPATDDRPFFFNVIRPSALFAPLPKVTQGTIEGNLVATRTLGLACLASMVLVLVAIGVPLFRRGRLRRAERPKGALPAGLAYFALIGVGFMLAEIALLQRLSLVLGHPLYSLVVVLASLVAAAGIGSGLSDRLPLDEKPWCFVYPAVLALVVALLAFVWPPIAAALAPASTAARIGGTLAITALLGVFLGIAFPVGMRLAKPTLDDESPWLWGMNGVGSVLASSVAILIALTMGLTSLMLCAAVCYLALLPCVAGLRKARDAARASEPAEAATAEEHAGDDGEPGQTEDQPDAIPVAGEG